jgi:hypothetical protein
MANYGVDTVASGAVRYLRTFPDIAALLGAFPAGDVNAGLPYIFQEDLLVTLEGQSCMAVVCSEFGGWGPMSLPLTTPQYMRLSLEVYADPQRDSFNNISESRGGLRQRTMQLFQTVNSHLHRTDPDPVVWGDLRTVGCELLTRPQPQPVPDGDMMQVWQAFYGVLVLGAVDIPVV